MASSFVRRECNDQRPSLSATPPRRFLKVILDDTSRNRKLRIPKSFLDKCGEDLLNWVSFKLPCGLELKIGLTSYNGKVWFRKRWPEFSKLYSLEKGYSLLFGYEGDSKFQVSMFDGSNGMEIDYTTRRRLDILEDIPSTALSHKKNRTVSSPNADMNIDSEERVKKETHWSKSEMKRKDPLVAERDGGDKETKLFQRTKYYNCSFKVLMRFTSINENLLVSGGKKTWPVTLIYDEAKGRVRFQSGWTDFVRDKSLKEGDACEFVLVDSNRLVFEVGITTSSRTMSPDIDDSNDEDDEQEDEDDSDDESIESLDHFLQLLKRKEKSPLQSQLRKRKRPSSRTQVFPEGRPIIPRKMHPSVTESSEKYIALQRAHDFKSANPEFKISIRPSYFLYLYVPAKFANIYLVKQPSHAILQVERKRTWSVNFQYTAKNQTTFRGGWSKFWQDNNLKQGDACVFMLTDKIKFLFDVVILRST